MRLTILVLLLLLLAPAGNCIAGKPDETAAAPVSVPFESYGTFILVPVQVNGSAPLSFILDTGFNRTLINPKRAKALGLGHTKEFHAGWFTLALTTGKKTTLQIGGARLENVGGLSPPFSFDELEEALGRRVDGMFGSDLLQRYVVEIDYAGHTLNLYDPKSYHYVGPEQPIPIRIKNRVSFVECQIIPNVGGPVAGSFELDTGSDGALDLFHAFVQRHRLLESTGKMISNWNWTAAGEQEDRIGRMKAFRVGRFTFDNPIVEFPTITKGAFGHRSDYAGLLGGEILQRFKLILDYTHKWMVLEPNARLAEPFEWDMSGMQLDAMGTDFSTYVVSGVRAQSPGEEAGLQKGDVVIAIDGTPVTTLGLREIDRMFKQEGREVRLSIKRDKQNLEVKLKLRRLI